MNKRLQLIKKWVEYSPPDGSIIEELKSFGWNYDLNKEEFKVTKIHLINILNRYLHKELSKKDVYKWADFLEMRPDIDYKEIVDYIYLLANPDVNGQLTKRNAEQYLIELKKT